MLSLDSIGTAVKAGAVTLLLAGLAGAAWLYVHMKGQISDLTRANGDLQASVVVANGAAEISAQSAQAIAAADVAAQAIVASLHAQTAEADLKTDNIMGDFNHAPASDRLCPADAGLPVAYLRGLDQLFGQPAAAGGSPGGPDRHAEAAAGMHPGLPALARPATAP